MFVTATFSGDFALAQYMTDGTLDPSFGIGGKVTTDFNGGSEVANAVAVQTDGRVVAAGVTQPPTGLATFALARYLAAASDTTPPKINVPADLVVNATGPAGAIVTYTVTAADDTDPNPQVSCTPSSGTTFAIGTTAVNCTATDASGNQASASFTVHVKGAPEQLADLGTAVAGVGPGTSLADKVKQMQNYLAQHDVANACLTLQQFIDQVRAQSGKSIPIATATTLTADATRIKNVLAC
jgi:hypothetical protein